MESSSPVQRSAAKKHRPLSVSAITKHKFGTVGSIDATTDDHQRIYSEHSRAYHTLTIEESNYAHISHIASFIYIYTSLCIWYIFCSVRCDLCFCAALVLLRSAINVWTSVTLRRSLVALSIFTKLSVSRGGRFYSKLWIFKRNELNK